MMLPLLVLSIALDVAVDPAEARHLAARLWQASFQARMHKVDAWELAYDCARESLCAGDCGPTMKVLAANHTRTKPQPVPDCAALAAAGGDPAAWIEARVRVAATRARPVLAEVEQKNLDCALAGLGLAPPNEAACLDADTAAATRGVPALALAAPDHRLALLAEFCAELSTCAGACTGYLTQVATSDPASRLTLEPCIEAVPELGVHVDARGLEAWVERRVARFAAKVRPRVPEAQRQPFDCALTALGLAPAPKEPCPPP
jgi:hypothetical protein